MTSTPKSSSPSSTTSEQTDPILNEFLASRGLPSSALACVGARWDRDRRRILFPRYGREQGQACPPSEVAIVGWKVRDLSGIRPKHYYEPSGIEASATWPLIARNVFTVSGLFICEGETDTMRLALSSVANRFNCDVICCPGNRTIPDEWIPFIRSYEQVWAVPDADDAGANLRDRVARSVPGSRVVTLPRGDDVCSFLLQHSGEDLALLVQSAPVAIPPRVQPPRVSRRQSAFGSSLDQPKFEEKLTAVVSRDVELRPRGKEFIGKCPFHDDSSPSLSVNPEKGLWQCFGCNSGGDVVDFVRKLHGMSYKDAVAYVKDIR